MGPQEDFFTPDAKRALVESEFMVSKDADRVGIRLDGPRIDHAGAFEMTSEGTVTGNIQVPGNGNPIILLMDRSTTAGYPKIATIVSADIPRVARMIPGQKIRFAAISQHDAIAYSRARNRYLKELIGSICPVVRTDMDSAHLLSVNLIDGVVNAGAD
jgi:allophanate hydrolase subunit 2